MRPDMKPGEIYVFTPFAYEYNPERHRSPVIGLFLKRIKHRTGWGPSKFKILSPEGVEELWSNRWSSDPVPEFVGEE